MAITEQTHLYEVLLRFGPEGLTGAHQRSLSQLVDDSGTVLMEREGVPEALTPAALAGLIDGQTADLLAQLAALQAEIVTIQAETETLGRENAALQAALRDSLAAASQGAPAAETLAPAPAGEA